MFLTSIAPWDPLEHISDYDPFRAHARRADQKHPGTTGWILVHPYYEAWERQEGEPCLWISGIVGSGKSTIVLVTQLNTQLELLTRLV